MTSGQSKTMTLTLFALQNNNLTARAQVSTASPTDPDSSPNNMVGNTPAEDDEAAVTVTPGSGGGGGGGGGTDADLSVDISTSATGYNVGTVEPFIVKVTNNGPGTATGVKLKLNIPSNLMIASFSSPNGIFTPANGVWDLGSIPSGSDRTLILNGQATIGGTVTLFAQVQEATANDPDSTPGNDTNQTANEDDEALHSVEALQVDMELDLSLANGSSANIPLNGQVTFLVSVTNYGPSLGENTKIRCILPAGLGYISSSATLGSYNSALGVWIVGNFPAFTTQVLTLTAQGVTAGNISCIFEVRTVNQPDVDSTPSNFVVGEDDQDELIINVGGSGGGTNADLSLLGGTTTASVVSGATANTTFTLQNGGPAAATGVTVKLNLPASGVSFTTATPSVGSYSAATSTWTVGTVNAGANATLTLSGAVSATSGSLTTFGQVQTNGAPDPDSTPGNDTNQTPNEDDEAAVSITVGAAATPKVDLALTMTETPLTFTAGDTLTYTLTLTNTGDTIANGVTVKDLLPAALTFVSATPSGVYSSSTGIWTVGTLTIGGATSLTIKAKTSGTVAITNFAQVQTATPADLDSSPGNDTNNTANEDDEALVTATPNPILAGPADLSLAISSNVTAPGLYTYANIIVTVTNNGPNAATGVSAKYSLPTGMAFSSQTVGTGSYSSWNGAWTIGNLAAGQTATLTITEFVLQLATTHFAQVQTSDNSDPDSTPGNDTNSTPNEDDEALFALPNVATPPKKMDLALTMTTSNTNFQTNQNVTFTLTVNNNSGDTTAYGVTVKDLLPTGFTFVSASPSGNYVSSTGIWTVGNLAVGGSSVLTIVANPTATSGNLVNFAQVQTGTPLDKDSTPGNDTNNTANEDDEAIVSLPFFDGTPKIDLALTMSSSQANYTTGQNITLTLTCTNTGTTAANSVTVKDILPAGMTFVSANPAADFNSSTGIWNIVSLAIGASETLTLTVTITATSGDIVNFAQVQTATPVDIDSSPGNDTNNTANEDDEAAITVSPVPTTPITDLELNLTASNNNPAQWTHVNMILTVTNTSTVAATNVTCKYPVPTGMAFAGSSTATGSYSGWNGIWTVGTLAAGQTATLTVDLFVNQIASNHFAQVQTASPTDTDSTPGNDTNNSDNEDDEVGLSLPNIGPVVKKPDLALSMTANVTSVSVGTAANFTITVANSGDTTAYGVTVKDVLPNALTYVGASAPANYNSATGIWTIGNIAPGGNASITLQTEANTVTASITNFAQVQTATPNDTDSTPGNDTNNSTNEDDEAAVTLTPVGAGNTVDLALGLATTSPNYSIYTNVTYNLTITNTGFVSATGVTVDFPFPTNMVYTSKTESVGAYDLNTKKWTVGTLLAGQSATLQLVLFNLSDVAPITAFVQVATASPNDSDSTPGNDTNQVADEDDEASITVTKSIGLFVPDDRMNVPMYVQRVWPNPVVDWIDVVIKSDADRDTRLVIINSAGQPMRYLPVHLNEGENDTWLELYDLPSGYYIITIEDAPQRIPAGRFIKE